jgi:hypothetical protein
VNANEQPDAHKNVFVRLCEFVCSNGRLGFIAVCGIVTLVKPYTISSLLPFAIEDKLIVRFLVFGVATAVWHLSRSWFRDARLRECVATHISSTNESAEIQYPHERIRFYRRYRPRSFFAFPRRVMRACGLNKDSNVNELGITFNGQMRGCAVWGYLSALLLFTLYFVLHGVFVYNSENLTKSVPYQQGSSEVTRVTFFRPIIVSRDFKDKVRIQSNMDNYKSGFRYLVDNDPFWLKDHSDTNSWQVMSTKSFLLIIIIFATAAFIFSTTVVSLLGKDSPPPSNN